MVQGAPAELAVSPPVNIPPQYADRRTGLVIFGVGQIILGLLAALMVPLVALSVFVSHLAPGARMRPGQFLGAIASYAFIAAALLTLGIGSVQCRRWARALTVVTAWYWLVTGVLITVLLTAALPVTVKGILQAQRGAAAGSPALSEGVMAVILTIIIVFAAFFLIIVPAAFAAFYGRRDVAETCRHRDPVERWTDRVPLPVLGACLVFSVQSLYLLLTGFSTPLFPFFGRYLTGVPGFACYLTFAVVDGALAIAFYGLKPAAWWVAVIAAPIRLASMALTFLKADLIQAYSKMGFTSEELKVVNSSPLLRGHVLLWWGLISAILFLGYVIWLKRYFQTRVSPQVQALPAQV